MRESLYFAFVDGSLAYDCASCGSKCCRGFGLGVHRRKEMPVLLGEHRDLGYFAAPSDRFGEIVNFQNYSPGCRFLENDGLCSIESDHGYGAKPGVCRLFPFAHIRCVGDRLAIAPQLDCPLAVTPPGRSPASDHAKLAALIEEVAESGEELGASRLGPRVFPDVLIELEERLRDLSAERLSSEDLSGGHVGELWVEQLAITTSLALDGEDALGGPVSEARRSDAGIVLREYRRFFLELLELEEPRALSPASAALLAALAPGIRLHHLLDWPPMQSPMMLAAIETYAAATQALGPAPLAAPGLKRLIAFAEPVLTLMTYAFDVPRVLRPELLEPAAREAPAPLRDVLRALLRSDGRTLREVLAPVEETRGLERMDLLRSVGRIVRASVAFLA